MAVGDIAQVTIRGGIHGVQTNNVLSFRSNNSLTDVNSILVDLLDCVRTTLFPALSNDWVLDSLRGKVIYPAPGDEIIIAAESTDKGNKLTGGDVSFAAALVQVRTGLGGRSKRGRFFLAGVDEGGIESSRLTNGELALIAAFAACLAGKFLGGFGLTGWNLGVYSRKLRLANPNEPANFFFPATQLVAVPVVATMHSRKIGQGV
jgi:hypothetical protein